MNYNPFEQLHEWLDKKSLTRDEKRIMKARLVAYATTHPVKSGLLSPYHFRYIGFALASLVLVLGGSIGVTAASASALPNQPLYGIKIWIEEVRANSQKTPSDKIAFETTRINTRFNEAATLAVRGQLNDSNSEIIQSGLEHSRDAIRATADSIQEQDPELALVATNNLETAFSSNGRILATIEKTTNQHVGSIVLAAQVTTETLATEKVKFEKIVALKPNTDTRAATELKLADITAKLAIPVNESPTSTLSATDTGTTSASSTVMTTSGTSASTASTAAPAGTQDQVQDADANSLVTDAKKKISQGAYSEALVSLQKAQQVIDEAALTKKLEVQYKITADPAVPAVQ